MVLPEIEEEDEDFNQRHSKLSLTSLLLGKYAMNGMNANHIICALYDAQNDSTKVMISSVLNNDS